MVGLPGGDEAEHFGFPVRETGREGRLDDSAVAEASVEVGTETFEVEARVTDPAERQEVYARQAVDVPAYGEYQKQTTRTIPVVALKRIQ